LSADFICQLNHTCQNWSFLSDFDSENLRNLSCFIDAIAVGTDCIIPQVIKVLSGLQRLLAVRVFIFSALSHTRAYIAMAADTLCIMLV